MVGKNSYNVPWPILREKRRGEESRSKLLDPLVLSNRCDVELGQDLIGNWDKVLKLVPSTLKQMLIKNYSHLIKVFSVGSLMYLTCTETVS